jgi:N4-gp56 family major capsid protein
MADTTTGSVAWDTTAYEQIPYFALRAENYFDAFCEVKPTRQTHPGAAVKFNITADIAVVSSSIDESTDIDAVALSDSEVTATLAEYGNAVRTTQKLRGTSYLPAEPIAMNIVGYNAGASIDTIVRDVAKLGSNVRYVGSASARNTVTPADHFGTSTGTTGAAAIRRAVAELRGANVQTIGGAYVGFIHPDVSYDLRGATGGANWRDPHTYVDTANIYNGEIGQFEGVRFIEAVRAPIFSDAGSSTTLTDVYRTMILGREALAKAWSITDGGTPQPQVFPTPVTDLLRRFLGVAWYHLVAYAIFRQASLRGIESSSSIGANAA